MADESLDFEAIKSMLIEMMLQNNSSTAINLWFGDLKLVSLDINEAIFVSPTDLKKKILTQRFAVEIADHLANILGFEPSVVIHSSEHGDIDLTHKDLETFKEIESGNITHKEAEVKINNLQNYSSEHTFENFIVGSSNKMAHSVALAVASQDYNSGDIKPYNPLFIYGNSGVGKTHLLYAIVNEILRRHPNKSIKYVKGEEFANQLFDAMGNHKTKEFREKYRSADVLLIDDIHFVAGKAALQEEFFNTFNAVYDSNKQIIFTSDRPPNEIKTLQDRLKTRFMSGILVDIQLPDFDLRCAILKQKSQLHNLMLSPPVISFLAENITTSIRQLEGAIKKLGAIQLLEGGDITLERVKNSIKEFLPTRDSEAKKMDDIILAVCNKFQITREDIMSTKRTKEIAIPRHICVYVARTCTKLSQSQIGKAINRDRTTVIASESFVKDEMAKNPAFSMEVEDILREININ